MDDLHARGAVRLAGPFTDWTGALLVVDATDADEVRRLLEPDPWVAELDVMPVGDIRPWTVWLGELPDGHAA